MRLGILGRGRQLGEPRVRVIVEPWSRVGRGGFVGVRAIRKISSSVFGVWFMVEKGSVVVG